MPVREVLQLTLNRLVTLGAAKVEVVIPELELTHVRPAGRPAGETGSDCTLPAAVFFQQQYFSSSSIFASSNTAVIATALTLSSCIQFHTSPAFWIFIK